MLARFAEHLPFGALAQLAQRIALLVKQFGSETDFDWQLPNPVFSSRGSINACASDVDSARLEKTGFGSYRSKLVSEPSCFTSNAMR